MMTQNLTILIISLIIAVLSLPAPSTGDSAKENKYSKEANLNLRELRDPFRMAKVNAVWNKALHKLTDTKLKSLYTDLSAHDSEQVKLKRLLSDGLDQDGLQEALVRKKFKEILSNYGLLEHFGESPPPKKQPGETFSRDHNEINKSLFKDKKLAKLWEKAERSGFDEKELKVLKQEFIHHQDKIDEYYSILEREDLTNNEHSNFLDPLSPSEHEDHLDKSKLPSSKYPTGEGRLSNVNDVRTNHRNIKDGYDILHKKVASGPNSQEFAEPRVANLWELARQGDFNEDELESLRQELKHYEKRMEKMHFFTSELAAKKLKHNNNPDKEFHHTEKDTESFYEDKVKRHERHLEKLHSQLETKILNRHQDGEL